MKSASKAVLASVAGMVMSMCQVHADSIPSADGRALQWRVGVEAAPSWVPGTNRFLKGDYAGGRCVDASLAGAVRADFSFNPQSRTGRLYPGLYQGVGVGFRWFMSSVPSAAEEMWPYGGARADAGSPLGTPVSVYVYQGAPVVHLSRRVWIGYEWQFGAAMGWRHYEEGVDEDNVAAGTSVTAHIGLGVKVHWQLADRWVLSAGVDAAHFSNGNTSWPNSGINTLGGSVGVAYIINPQPQPSDALPQELREEADRQRWLIDIVAYGAWRKRVVGLDGGMALCPGKFGVAGVQVAPMRKFNRWVSAGVALDMQFDESAGLAPYHVEGTSDDYLKFYRPPFGKQLSVGLSAHAELTMPVFAVNAGLGYDVVSPQGNKRFYQSLVLKAFLTRNLFLNVGYRLGSFSDPQNLMLGVGMRL